MNGNGTMLRKEDINQSVNLKNYTFERFQQMCILSGCDYVQSIKGIGLHRGRKIIEAAGENDVEWAIANIKDILNMPKLVIPDGYWETFRFAQKTFLHQSVFDPATIKIVPLTGTNDPHWSLYPL
jgi:exonuclease-1